MQTVASILLLVTVAMTVQASDISEDLSLPPLQDHMYFFDITTEASVSAVKEALKDFTIDQSFKVIGEDRMFITIRSNSTAQLRKLTFPSGSKVTQYPVETIKEYLDLYEAGSGWEEDYTQTSKMNAIYMFLDWEMQFPMTMCTTTYGMVLREFSRKFRKIHSMLKPLLYPLLAAYPSRVLYFMKLTENDLQNMIKAGLDIMGGPGSGKLAIKRIVRV